MAIPYYTKSEGKKLDERVKTLEEGGGTGTNVEANPEGTASIDLNKIRIGTTNYRIPSGGSGGVSFIHDGVTFSDWANEHPEESAGVFGFNGDYSEIYIGHKSATDEDGNYNYTDINVYGGDIFCEISEGDDYSDLDFYNGAFIAYIDTSTGRSNLNVYDREIELSHSVAGKVQSLLLNDNASSLGYSSNINGLESTTLSIDSKTASLYFKPSYNSKKNYFKFEDSKITYTYSLNSREYSLNVWGKNSGPCIVYLDNYFPVGGAVKASVSGGDIVALQSFSISDIESWGNDSSFKLNELLTEYGKTINDYNTTIKYADVLSHWLPVKGDVIYDNDSSSERYYFKVEGLIAGTKDWEDGKHVYARGSLHKYNYNTNEYELTKELYVVQLVSSRVSAVSSHARLIKIQ